MKFDKDHQFKLYELEFGLKSLVNQWLIILLSLGSSLLLHSFWDTLTALIALSVLRRYTGGHHFKSNDVCVIFTVSLVVLGIPYLTYLALPVIPYIEVITFILILFLAPFDAEGNSLKRKAIATLLVILSICFPFSEIVVFTCFCQSIDLIKLGSVRKDV